MSATHRNPSTSSHFSQYNNNRMQSNPSQAFTNNIQQHRPQMSNNPNSGFNPNISSACLQVLGSDPKEKHLLCYCATEDEWDQYLKVSQFYDSTLDNKPKKIPQHTLQPTAGGPNDILNNNESNQTDKKYAIISIMGPQSSGKSTILNRLFGTKFEVMDHKKGRQQITTGIWLGSCPKAKDLMILDLEGTDSIERKQNRSNFERQTSLMALTLSEILIINLWAADIGRSSGMNVDTLRAILAANLRLFAPNSKTKLLFLIREQSPDENQFGVTPVHELQRIITKVVEGIWSEIDKPDNFLTTPITDLFDIDFYFMPPLVYFADLFNQRVHELYDRFTNPQNSNYYFSNNKYHYSKCVPPEGLSTWTQQIFKAITSDESLNIPDQQKLLAAFRCEHASHESYKIFQDKMDKISDNVKLGYVDKFGSQLNEIIAETIYNFKETANKYDKEIALEKYEDLVDKIETQCQFLFSFQYKHLTKKVTDLFEYEMNNALPNGQCCDNLEAIVQRIGGEVRKFFSSKIDECLIKTENKKFLNKEQYWKETQIRLRECTKSIQIEQYNLLCKENELLIDSKLLSQISKLLRSPTEKIWSQISLLRIEYFARILNIKILSKLKNLMFEDNKYLERNKSLRLLSDNLIIARCKKYCERMDSVLQDRFDYLFKKNPENGIPRKWDENVKIDEIFTIAKQQCIKILRLSQEITLESNKDLGLNEIKLRLLSSDTMDEIEQDFNKYADSEYRRAEGWIRASKQNFGGILPSHPVTWAIFLFFAKDEIWSMITNPLYLILMIFGGLLLFIGYQAHTYGLDIQSIVIQMFTKIISLIINKLNDFQQQQVDIQRRGGIKKDKLKRQLNETETDNGNKENENDDNNNNLNATPQ